LHYYPTEGGGLSWPDTDNEREDIVGSNVVNAQRRRPRTGVNSVIGNDMIINGHRNFVPGVRVGHVIETDRCPAKLDSDDHASLNGSVPCAQVSAVSDKRSRVERR